MNNQQGILNIELIYFPCSVLDILFYNFSSL